MKTSLKTTVILIFALALSTVITGCAGCGNDTTPNADEMVESTPAAETEEGIIEDDNALEETQIFPSEPATDGGNSTANDINGATDTNGVVDENGYTIDENGNRVDANGNIIEDGGNIISEAGDAVGDAMDNVGNAVDDVVDGAGDGVRDLTR